MDYQASFERRVAAVQGPRNFKILRLFNNEVLEFNQEEEHRFKLLLDAGLPESPVDITRELTGKLTASFSSPEEAQSVTDFLVKKGLTQK